jgi:protein-L-isoaspartate(D-aspartate) O-methyltransferase
MNHFPRLGRDLALLACAAILAACNCSPAETPTASSGATARKRMVERQLVSRGIKDVRVLAALGAVPRQEFVPPRYRALAYDDHPLPIGQGQTISQPYIVALMTEAIGPRSGQRVLEVGTGSGYQAAVLGELVGEVYTIELLPELAAAAKKRLARLGYRNVHVKAGDGYQGWPDKGPFDAVVVTCGAKEVPRPLLEQLKPGGKMVIPVGEAGKVQTLRVITKGLDGKREVRDLLPVRFVPLRRAGKTEEKRGAARPGRLEHPVVASSPASSNHGSQSEGASSLSGFRFSVFGFRKEKHYCLFRKPKTENRKPLSDVPP